MSNMNSNETTFSSELAVSNFKDIAEIRNNYDRDIMQDIHIDIQAATDPDQQIALRHELLDVEMRYARRNAPPEPTQPPVIKRIGRWMVRQCQSNIQNLSR